MSASAAESSNEISFSVSKIWRYNKSDGDPQTISYSTFASGSNGNISAVAIDNTITLQGDALNNNYEAGYITIKSEVTVPARKEYVFDLSVNLIVTKYSADDTSAPAAKAEFFYFGDSDKSSEITFATHKIPGAQSGTYSKLLAEILRNEDGTVNGVNEPAGPYTITGLKYTNNTDSPKTFNTYFGMFADVGYATHVSNRFNASCTIDNELTVNLLPISSPKNINVTYDGNSKWVTDLGTEKPSWYVPEIYDNSEFVSDIDILYTDNVGVDTNKTVTTSQIIQAGTYTVTLKLAGSVKWSDDGTTQDKSFTLKINKANPNVTAALKEESLRGKTLTLPPSGATLPELTNIHDEATAGEFKWASGEKPKSGTNTYKYTFTPKDDNDYTIKNNYAELTNQSFSIPYKAAEITGLDVTVTKDIYDRYTLGDDTSKVPSVKNCITVKPVYDVDGEDVLGDSIANEDYTLNIKNGGVFAATEGDDTITLVVKDKDKNVGEKEISVLKAVIVDGTLDVVQDNPLTYSEDLTIEDIKNQLTVEGRWGYAAKLAELTADDYDLTGIIQATADSAQGTPFTLTVKDGRYSSTVTVNVKINKGTLTPTVTFEGLTVTYDGSAKNIEATVSGLPDGVTLVPTYTVTGSATTYVADGYANAGTYNYSVSFAHDNPNYAQYTTPATATLTIKQAKITGIVFEDAVKPEITGTTYTLEATGYPSWVNVTYSVEGQSGTSFSAAGTYKFTATFSHSDDNYESIDPMTATLTISDKPPVEGADDIVVEPTISATYTGSPVDYAAQNVPEGVDVSYTIVKKDDAAFSGTEIIGAGEYTVTVSFDTGTAYAPIADKTCVVTVGKATVDMSGVEFADKTVTGNGQPHKVEATNLPQGVTVEYEYNGKKQTTPFEFTEVDDYTVKAYFTYEDEDNYNEIKPKEITLTISDAVIESISAKVEDGAKFTTVNTLDDLKEKLTVTAVYNNGTTAEVDNFELTCEGLRDGGKFKAGKQTITVKYKDEGGNEVSTSVEIEVAKVKVALPTFKGGISYTGAPITIKTENFTGFDEALMTMVADKTLSGKNAGSYKAVFALNDPENYDWATTTTLKKTVFAAVVYDGEVTLLANEAAVDWNISKAVLTATKTDNALPVFASESFIGAFSDVVTLKYYKDEACTEEVAAEDLKYETQYFVKAELLDTDNFELEASAAQYTVKSFSYTTPAKELTVWDKVVRFLKANWLWIVIAAVALILLILIIALAARAAKRKREREEQRRLEEKAERERKEERDREERRMEREERMAARMAMPQMMPQMPQMMGGQMPMQQSMPAAQPMATGGSADSAQMTRIETELAAMKAAQAAKELAEIKAEQAAMHNDINELKRGGVQDIGGGLTAATLVEIVTAAMEKVLESREKPAAQPAPAAPESAAPAATQVPPDAVMTTVTTTKIDTTKKPAQNAQAAAPVRTVVRNVVAPMPVDDGRVFDVGGFYKPADPITDMDFADDEKKDL